MTQPTRQQRDRPQIEAEFAPAHGDAGRIDQRRQHAEQHQLRRQLDARQSGHEGERHAGDHQQNRGRGAQPPGGERHHDQHPEQKQQCFDCRRHSRAAVDFNDSPLILKHFGEGGKGARRSARRYFA